MIVMHLKCDYISKTGGKASGNSTFNVSRSRKEHNSYGNVVNILHDRSNTRSFTRVANSTGSASYSIHFSFNSTGRITLTRSLWHNSNSTRFLSSGNLATMAKGILWLLPGSTKALQSESLHVVLA